MDIRARLLLAFTPLLAVLLFLALMLPLVASQGRAVMERQRAATDDLLRTQELALAIFFEHETVRQIADGEVPADSVRFRDARNRAEAIMRDDSATVAAAQAPQRQLTVAYGALARLHDQIVAAAAAGDLELAVARVARPEIDENLAVILSLSQEARDDNRREVTRINTEISSINQRVVALFGGSFGVGVILAIVLTWLLISQISRPLTQLAADAERYATGDLTGQLSQVGSIAQIRRLRDSFQALIDANLARQRHIQSAVDELEERVSREGRLRETLQSLSLPVVPLQEQTLLLPLVGYLDTERAQELTRGLLAAIQERRAKAVVLDITGLAAIDTISAAALRRTIDAARLLGCRIILVGVRSDQALTLISANLAASGVEIARDIPAALRGTRTLSLNGD